MNYDPGSLQERITDADRAAAERMRPQIEAIAAEAEQYLTQHFNLVTAGTLKLDSHPEMSSNNVTRSSFIDPYNTCVTQLRRDDLKRLTAAVTKLYRMYGRNREDLLFAIQLHAAVSANSCSACFKFGIPD